MARLGARLVRMEAHHWQQPLEGHLLAQENHLEQALGSDWLACLQRSNLKGIVLSPMRPCGAHGGDAWWRLGQSPLYPDLLLETCQSLFNQQASQSMGMEGRSSGAGAGGG